MTPNERAAAVATQLVDAGLVSAINLAKVAAVLAPVLAAQGREALAEAAFAVRQLRDSVGAKAADWREAQGVGMAADVVETHRDRYYADRFPGRPR